MFHEMPLKLYFMKCSERNILQCMVALRKSVVRYPTQLASGLLLKMLKYLEVMLNIIEFSHAKDIVES